jgi:hypothetical protein
MLKAGDIATIVGQLGLTGLGTIEFEEGTANVVTSALTALDTASAGDNPTIVALVSFMATAPEPEELQRSQAAALLAEIGLTATGETTIVPATSVPAGVTCPLVTLVFAVPNIDVRGFIARREG